MENHEKHHRIGILGGLGPATSAHFYLDVVERATREARPDILFASLPINLRKEAEYIASGKHGDHYLERLKEGARTLERGGCTQIVMPCNTVHEFHPVLHREVSVPFPNLIQLVAAELRRRAWTKVLLLATSRTIAMNLYQNAVASSTVELVTPAEADQRRLDLLIQRVLQQPNDPADLAFLNELREKANTEKVLLGCTDLQEVIDPLEHPETVVDSTECLVNHTVDMILN